MHFSKQHLTDLLFSGIGRYAVWGQTKVSCELTFVSKGGHVMITSFSPSEHGWPFSNAGGFEVDITILGKSISLGKFGFCGGMCRSALKRYLRGEAIARTVKRPTPNSVLYKELLGEQITAMVVENTWGKVLDWITRPSQSHWHDRHSIGYLMKRDELPKLFARMDAGLPTVICVIRNGTNPTDSHMVVATGYDYDGTTLTVSVYDPNHPDDDTVSLSFVFASTFSASQSCGESTRGFFVISQEGMWESVLGSWVKAKTPPHGAIVGGKIVDTRFPVYVGRIARDGNLHPGKVAFYNDRWSCYIGNGGVEESDVDYEVFVGQPSRFGWSRVVTNSLPDDAVIGGHIVDTEAPVYVGRVNVGGNVHPGKVAYYNGKWSCYIGNGGTEQSFDTYEVLVHVTPQVPSGGI